MNKISIIIPHHRDEDSLRRLVFSLNKQKVSVPFEIIIVSNPPSDKADYFLKQHSNVVHIQTDTVGVNNARNLGIKAANADILVFLDSDCEMISEDFLSQHYNYHLQDPSISCVGGTYIYSGNLVRDLTYNYIQRRWLLRGLQGENARYLIGGNFSCKKSDLSGREFDDKIVYGGSETEFFLRLCRDLNIKLRLYQNLGVGHNTRLSRTEFIKKAFKQGRGARYIHQKLQLHIEANSTNEQLNRFETSHYKKKMDFWLSLYDVAYNLGYSGKGSISSVKAAQIFTLRVFNHYRIKASDFFASLEERLRNFSSQ